MMEEPPPSTLISRTLCLRGIAKQYLFGRRALTPQSAALPDGKLLADLGFRQPCQRQIEVVAAEKKVFADRRAGEVDLVAISRNADQGKSVVPAAR